MAMASASRFLGSSGSRVLLAVLTAAGAGLFVAAITVLLGRTQARVERQLAGYQLPEVGPDAGPAPASGMMSQPETAVVPQAVSAPSRPAGLTRLLERTELRVAHGELPLRPAAALFY